MSKVEFLQGQLERLFELDGLMAMSRELLGLEPTEVGGTNAKGTFARALVRHCEKHDGLTLLAEAVRISSDDDDVAEMLPRSDDELAPESEVRNFRVLRTIARGPLATTYLAEKSGDGAPERAHLAVFHHELSRDRIAVFRLLRAARALASLRDGGLAGIYEAGSLPDGRAFVASEAVQGQTLTARIERTGPLRMDELRSVARTLLRGLAALHDRGQLHGYLSPDHVLIVRPESANQTAGVLTDLVTARLLERGGRSLPGLLRVVGDPRTLAPEVARGAVPTVRSEVYAIGCVLYYALTGQLPFEAGTPMEQMLAHVYEEAAPPSERAPQLTLSAELDEIFARALHKEPEERFATVRALADALEASARASILPEQQLDEEELARALEQLQAEPGDDARAAAIEALVAPTAAWSEALDALMQVVNSLDAPEQLEARKRLLFRCARIQLDELGDRQEAERSYRQVLELDPSDAQAHNALEELYRASGDHEGLVGLLLDGLESETSPATRAEILRDVATLYEHELAQRDNAVLAWTQALGEEASDERTRHALERLLSTPEQYEEAIATLHEALTNSVDRPAQALSLAVLIADWYAEKAKRLDAALHYLQEALRIDPAHEPALEALTGVYRKAEAWDELAQLLMQRADASSDPEKKRDIRAEAAALAYEKLSQGERAEAILVEVLRENPAHARAFDMLSTLYTERGELTKLLALHEAKLKELHGEARVRELAHVAELYEGDPEQHARAIELAREAIVADDKCLPAYKVLDRVYTARGEHAELRSVLERELTLLTTPQQRTAVLERLGKLYEEALGEPARAAEYYEQVIEIAPADEAANSALARLYRQLHRFDDLAQTYDRHAKGVESTERKVQLLMQAARVLMADLGSPDRAAFVCERVLALDAGQPEALALTARIRALAGDTLAAIDALELLVDGEEDPQRKADLLVRAGQMLESHDDLDGAIERYKSALEASPGSEAALTALGRLYDRRGDVRGEAELLLRRVELVSEPVQRGKRWVALGKLRLDKLKDKALAADAYERAHELDPDNREALLGLGQLALADKRWADASRWLEPLLEHTTELPSDVALELLLGAGDAFRALGQPSKAERAYLSAKAQSPDHRTVNERLAEVALESGRYDEAAQLLETLLDLPGQTIAPNERAELLLKLGEAHLTLGHWAAAVEAFSSASALSPEATTPLDALARAHEAAADRESLARTVARRLELTTDPDERFTLLVKLGDLHAQLGARSEAARDYVSALELNAEDRNLLTKLMSVYSESKDWSRLVDVLLRMARVVEEPTVRAKYLHTAAGITATELDDADTAIEYYESALGLDPALEPAFRGLTDCFTKAGAWDRLANLYRAHIERRRDALSAEQIAALFDKLGALYVERVHRIEPAIEAYEAAAAVDPEDRARLELLVDLYGRNPARFAERAISAHDKLLAHNPYRVESYRALRKLYTQLQRPDEAWTVCQALRSLNMAEPEEETFFKRHRVHEPATARECVHEELWSEHLIVPEQDTVLTQMFALIQPAAIAALAQPGEAFGIESQQPVDCENDEAVMARMLHYASGVALVPLPPVYHRPRDAGGISFVFTNPPAIGLGQGALREAPDQALAFLAARQLSYFRPGHYMRQLLPTGGALRGWLLAAIRLANPRFPVPDPLREQVERNHAALARTLHVPQQQALTSLVGQLLRDQPELDLKRWALAVDLVADRLGFVLANSLDAAVAVVRASPPESSFASERDRLKALYTFAVSPQYLALRKALGISIA